jgi:hypothetical protein
VEVESTVGHSTSTITTWEDKTPKNQLRAAKVEMEDLKEINKK